MSNENTGTPKNYDQWQYMYVATGVDKGGFVR